MWPMLIGGDVVYISTFVRSTNVKLRACRAGTCVVGLLLVGVVLNSL